MNKMFSCKHEHGFSLSTRKGVWQWWCKAECGFSLNFDPDEFPEGISITYNLREEKIIVLKPSSY